VYYTTTYVMIGFTLHLTEVNFVVSSMSSINNYYMTFTIVKGFTNRISDCNFLKVKERKVDKAHRVGRSVGTFK